MGSAFTEVGFSVHRYLCRDVSMYCPTNPMEIPSVPGNGYWDENSETWKEHKKMLQAQIKETVETIAEIYRTREGSPTPTHVFVSFCPIHTAWAHEMGFQRIVEFASFYQIAAMKAPLGKEDETVTTPLANVIFQSRKIQGATETELYGKKGYALSCFKNAVIPPILYSDDILITEATTPKYAIFVGKKDELHGLDVAVAAVAKYRSVTGDDLRLVVLGVDPAGLGEKLITAMNGHSEWVHSYGVISRALKKEMISRATVFLATRMCTTPSPGVAYEAIRCAVPTICTEGSTAAEMAADPIFELAHQVCKTRMDTIVTAITNVTTSTKHGLPYDWKENAKIVAQHYDELKATTLQKYVDFVVDVATCERGSWWKDVDTMKKESEISKTVE